MQPVVGVTRVAQVPSARCGTDGHCPEWGGREGSEPLAWEGWGQGGRKAFPRPRPPGAGTPSDLGLAEIPAARAVPRRRAWGQRPRLPL